jgi:hypothetical protein
MKTELMFEKQKNLKLRRSEFDTKSVLDEVALQSAVYKIDLNKMLVKVKTENLSLFEEIDKHKDRISELKTENIRLN